MKIEEAVEQLTTAINTNNTRDWCYAPAIKVVLAEIDAKDKVIARLITYTRSLYENASDDGAQVVSEKSAPVDGIDFAVANGQVFISNCFILDDNPVFSGVDWAKGCTPAGKAQVMPDFEGVSAMTQRECYRAGLEAGKATRMPDGWKQWIDDVVEYLNDGLETDGELEAEGSIEAKRLLAAAPRQEKR